YAAFGRYERAPSCVAEWTIQTRAKRRAVSRRALRQGEQRMRPITLTQAMRDQRLIGAPFVASCFWPWFAVAKLIDGERLDERELDLFRQCTGRTRQPSGPIRRLVLLAGRRAGKDRFLSAVAVHRAALAANWREHMSAGEQAVVLLLGR